MTTDARAVEDELQPAATIPSHRWPPAGRELFGEPIWRLLGVALGLLVIAATLAIASAHRGGGLSLLDEPTHADYAYQISHGRIPAAGTTLSPEILNEWSCRGGPVGLKLPPCGQPDDPPSAYPNGGYNYNFAHPPLYYLVTGTLARAGDALFSDDHFVAAGRLVGVGWLFAGMLVLYLAVRRFDIGWPYAAAAAALVPLCPGVLQASSTITNDAPAVLCGATALYLLAGVLITGRIGWVAPVLVTLLATATKVLNALPMLLLACVLLVLAFRRRRAGQSRESVRFAVIAIAIGITFLAVFKGWALFQSGRGQDGWVNPVLGTSGRPIGGNPINELLSTTFTGFPLVNGYYLPPQLNGELMTIWVSLFGVLIVASSFLAIAALPARTPQWAVGLTLLGGILLYPLLVELQVWVESSMYFPVVSPRYGMTLIPLALACLAFVAYRRRLRSATIFLTGFGLLATFLTTAGLTAIG